MSIQTNEALLSRQRLPHEHVYIFKVLAQLLRYPESIAQVLAWGEKLEVSNLPKVTDSLKPFLTYFTKHDIVHLAENYVATFDFNPSTTLYLSFHLAGEKPERIQLLLDLKALFKKVEFSSKINELPDYLPLIFEYLCIASQEDGIKILKDYMGAIKKLYFELKKVHSPYNVLIKAALMTTEDIFSEFGIQTLG